MAQDRERLMKTATYASVGLAVSLIVLKAWVWFASGSVSILASLIDSLMDSGASVINMIAVGIAIKPADKHHRFGHGKAESLAALVQAAFVAGSAVFLLLQAFDRLLHPKPITNTGWGMAVMVVSIAGTLALVAYQRYVVKRTHSQAIAADSLHYASDLLANSVVIVALLLTTWGIDGADVYLAFLLVLWIFKSAWDIAKTALSDLMDQELPSEDRQRIETLVLGVSGVLGMHDLRTRTSGANVFIQLHIELDDGLNIVDAHTITEKVERTLEKAFDYSDVIVHQDPVSVVHHARGKGLI
ncbi:MAG: cation diffusion facilitator family transporter [Neisseriaceae bacterium]|nr:cation diffusion facilitator family transporter [Neisseriaceae bacterium]